MSAAAFTPPLLTDARRASWGRCTRPRFTCTASPAASSTSLQRFLDWFRGDFDNCHQAVGDRHSGVAYSLVHEHIHCRLQPLVKEDLAPAGQAVVYASYWYNGNPEIVYRRRFYTVREMSEDRLEMRIYKAAFIHGLYVAKAHYDFESMDMGRIDDGALYEHLDGSQIMWEYVDGAHSDAGFVANGPHFVGTMRDGGFTAKDRLRYEDELVLTKEDLWVSERVFNSDGVMVGGNRDGIPHKMRRVRRQDELKWTLDLDLPDLSLPE